MSFLCSLNYSHFPVHAVSSFFRVIHTVFFTRSFHFYTVTRRFDYMSFPLPALSVSAFPFQYLKHLDLADWYSVWKDSVMVLHKVSAHRDRTSDRTVYQPVWQTVSPCELWRNSQRKLTVTWGLGCRCGKTERSNGQRKGSLGRLGKDWVWSGSSHLSGRTSDLGKMFTGRRTDGRRTPRDCISSWNELKITKSFYHS